MELFIILVLLLLNGFFSMYEIALVSSRKARLEEKAKNGSSGAKIALQLLENPEKILSAIQTGITLIGIISGAYGGLAIAEDLTPFIAKFPLLSKFAGEISVIVVVGFITYFSLIIGELVPKTLALNNPEKISIFFSPSMKIIAGILYPVVGILSSSTRLLLKLLRIKKNQEPPVTEEELMLLLKQGSEHGVFEKEESEMIAEVFRFSDRNAYTLMIPKMEVEWIKVDAPREEILNKILSSSFSRFPVCDGNIDAVRGIVSANAILSRIAQNQSFQLSEMMTQPLFIPENTSALRVLEIFRESKKHFGIVVNEYGSVEGIITLHDLAENILGDLPVSRQDESEIFQRPDGSWLVDGSFHLDRLMDELGIPEIEELKDESLTITTVGGLAMFKLDKVPRTGDRFQCDKYHFEIVDMDGPRVDKVLIVKS